MLITNLETGTVLKHLENSHSIDLRMSNMIMGHFKGWEPPQEFVKSIVLSVDNEKKAALSTSLEKFKKEVNTFLTECIEKNKLESADSQNSLTIDEEEIESEDETISEINVSQRPSKVPKLV